MLSPARTKLATLDKGQLMVRHPHFTQPIRTHVAPRAPVRTAAAPTLRATPDDDPYGF